MKYCTFEGCVAAVKAKGLCSTHYMRSRRTGDAAKVRAPGRPKSVMRELLPELSGRSLSRLETAMRCLLKTEGEAGYNAAVLRCTRPNGTINVSAIYRESMRSVMRYARGVTSRKGEQ